MAKLVIKRTSEWNNRMRDIKIYLDNSLIGTIGDGEVKEFQVPAGNHTLRFRIDWCGSGELKFDISGNETRFMEVSGLKLGKWFPFFLAAMCLYFAFSPLPGLVSLTVVTINLILLLCLGYHLSFGKNKYLRIRELKSSL
jgi:hypothetical protein